MRLGIATIYQELDLVDDLSVAENVFLGHEPTSAGFADAGTTARRTRELLPRLGHPEISPSAGSARCPPPASRSSAWRGRCPTTPGSSSWTSRPPCSTTTRWRNLFRIIRELTAQGIAVIYISHRLEEIREIGDRVTVLKDGRTVATEPAGARRRRPPTWSS